jgi:MFS family permease
VTEHAEDEPRYAWVMLAVGTVLVAMNLGALSSLSVFLKPVSAEFGWARGATALAYTAAALTIGASGVVWGRLADRFGTRPIALIGAVAQPTAWLLLATLVSLPQFYAFYILLGAFGIAAINVPVIANVGLWFTKRRGTALGILSAGGPLGQSAVAMLAGHVMVSYGWRTAYLALAVVYGVLAVPLALLIRTPPALSRTGPPGHGPGDAVSPISTPVLVAWLSVATIFCCTTMAVPIVHTVAMLTDRGMPYADALRVFFVIMGSGVLGRVLLGRLTDHLGGLKTYFLASLLQTGLVFWFTQVESLPALYLLSALFGVGFSGVMTSVWVCIREMVPARVAATALAVVVGFAWVGMGFGGWHGGHAFDLTGSYTRPYLDAVGSGVVNLLLVGALLRYVGRARRARALYVPSTPPVSSATR